VDFHEPRFASLKAVKKITKNVINLLPKLFLSTRKINQNDSIGPFLPKNKLSDK
jgi:hypothetical protein